jgi:hypothetical protein
VKIAPIATIAAVSILLLVGCSAPSTPEPAPDVSETTEPAPVEGSAGLDLPIQTVGEETDCSAFASEAVSTLWGVPITTNDVSTVLPTGGLFDGKIYSCDFNETDSGAGLTVELAFREYDSVDGAIQYMNDIRDGASFEGAISYEIEDISGLGEEAFFTDDSIVTGTDGAVLLLYTRTDNLMLLLSATNLDGIKPDYKQLLQDTYSLFF